MKPEVDVDTPTSDRPQEAVFRLLGNSGTFGGAPVKRCDTHAAAVFLAGGRAYKVKRAVRFPFLDYSTLDKRKAACLAELEINRAFAPQLYLRIVPITREPGGWLALDGSGEPVEWAVEMARFDEQRTLDHLADRGELSDALPAQLAAAVAAMHENAPAADTEAWLAAMERFIGENTAAFRAHDDIFDPNAIAQLDRESRAAFERLRLLLAERGRHGLVRRGHGDLHLGNIAMLNGEPVAFDAIEFDPIIASGDVLYDLAFLLMDLIERDFVGAANQVLNGYFTATRRSEDCDGIAALPFFISMRAAIRANVTAVRRDQAPAAERPTIARSAARYFQLALDALAAVVPAIVCTGGLSGTGKSVLARALAPLFPPLPGALVLRSDVERKAMFGIKETEKLPVEAYRPGVSARVYADLNDKAARIARAGHSVIVDAVFARAEERGAIEAVARAAGVEFRGLFLTADLQTRLSRVGTRGPDASDANTEVARQQETFPIGALSWTSVDASGTPDATLTHARKALSK